MPPSRTHLVVCEHKLGRSFSVLQLIPNYYFSSEPLIPYNVTVVAVNLAGPGEQETTNFFTRQGGVFLTNCVYGKLLINFCVHFVDSQSST